MPWGWVQAVVLVALEQQAVKFIHLFRNDSRVDPNCSFMFMSPAYTPDRRLLPSCPPGEGH